MSAAHAYDLEVSNAAALAASRSGRSSSGLAGARENPVRGTGTVERRAMTVLVVEPDGKLRRLLEVGLGKAGFQVAVAASAEEGLVMVGPLRPLPSLVIAEASLKGARGLSFCEQLREEPRTQALPILALASEESVSSGTGIDVLRKPVFVRDVVALAVLKAGKHCMERIFECDTELLPVADLVRALLAGNACGRLAMASGDQLDFRDGKIVRAVFEAEEGERALRRILLFGTGAFSVRLGPITPAGDFSVGLREFCRTSLPRVRRFERVLPRSLPLEARLALELPELIRQLDQLPAEIERLARLFDGHRTVRDALIDADMEEPLALESLTKLYELGVLSPAPAPQSPVLTRGELIAVPAPSPSGMLEGLPQDAVRQLEAFRIRTVSDRPAPRLTDAVRSAPVLEILSGTGVDRAVPFAPAQPVKRARLAVAAQAELVAEPAPSAPAQAEEVAPPSLPTGSPAPAPSRGKNLWAIGAAILATAGLLAATALVRGRAPIAVKGAPAHETASSAPNH